MLPPIVKPIVVLPTVEEGIKSHRWPPGVGMVAVACISSPLSAFTAGLTEFVSNHLVLSDLRDRLKIHAIQIIVIHVAGDRVEADRGLVLSQMFIRRTLESGKASLQAIRNCGSHLRDCRCRLPLNASSTEYRGHRNRISKVYDQ